MWISRIEGVPGLLVMRMVLAVQVWKSLGVQKLGGSLNLNESQVLNCSFTIKITAYKNKCLEF